MINETEATKPLYSVSSLTNEIRQQLEEEYDWVQVRGELSGFKRAPSGHAYFRLKDANAVLECVAWKGTVARWGGLDLQDGVEVITGGKITLYPPRGQYQLVVSTIRLAGIGALQQRFDVLKRMLAEEGLFDAATKKDLPVFPKKVAVITSPTGAAVRDFLRIVSEGNCPVCCTVCPVLVQGEESAAEISRMIETVNQSGEFDLIVLCRGGGSIEDLWSFNEEIVARSIHQSDLPVISAIGHEIDFTISDFAADMRAPTPTAAGQLVLDLFEYHRSNLHLQRDRLYRLIVPLLEREKERLEVSQQALKRYHPITVLAQKRQRLDDIMAGMIRSCAAITQQKHSLCKNYKESLQRFIVHSLEKRRQAVRRCDHLLHSYDPARNLARGYSLCRTSEGRLVRRIADVKVDDSVQVVVSDGAFSAQVTKED
jgi:exodeoxyribonuclease VII large subunit